MKNFYVNFLGIVFSLFFFCNSYAQGDFEIPQNKIDEVSRVLQISDYYADIVLRSVITLVQKAQKVIGRIASHETDYSDKMKQWGYIDIACKKYFLRDAIIQVSSINRRRLKNFRIKDYLEHLAELSVEKYVTVKLDFDNDYMKIGNIYKYNDEYYFAIDTFQIFIGCKGDAITCYKDVTKKVFGVKLIKGASLGGDKVAIHQVSATETMTLDDFRNRWR
jgi:hypothetical protein